MLGIDGAGLTFVVFIGIFVVVFVLIVSLVIAAIVKGVLRRRAIASAPPQQLAATIVAKRSEVIGGGDTRAVTLYYVTLETSDGQRREFKVTGDTFGLLAEHDRGVATFRLDHLDAFTRS